VTAGVSKLKLGCGCEERDPRALAHRPP